MAPCLLHSLSALSSQKVSGSETFDYDFDLFVEERARILRILSELLDLRDEITVVSIRQGSTKLTITLTREHAEQLLWLYESGILNDLNIKDAKVIGSAAAEAIVRNKEQSNSYDVFICHNSEDKPEVSNSRRGIKPSKHRALRIVFS